MKFLKKNGKPLPEVFGPLSKEAKAGRMDRREFLAMASAFVVTHLAAVNALSLRTGLLPKWVTWLGLVSAAVFLVSTLGSTTDADAIVVFGFIGFITWAIWLLAVAVHMWRTADAN